MQIREFINTDKAYGKVEEEIRKWVEKSYPGLTIEFNYPAPEIVQTDSRVKYKKSRVKKIVEAVNIRIGDVLTAHAEEIYIADLLERIYKRHPDFTADVSSIDDIKSNRQFLQYLRELKAV